MARALRKKTVDVGAPAVRVSRIRRDPPPPVKEVTAADLKDRDESTVVIGVTSFAIALLIILAAVLNTGGWDFSHYTVVIE